MKKTRLFEWEFWILAFGVLVVVCQGTPVPGTGNNATAPMAGAVQLTEEASNMFVPFEREKFSVFDWNLYKRMANNYEGNFLISPFSAKCALVLLYEGAQDETAHQLASVMNLPAGRWDTREKFRVILRSLKPAVDEYRLDVGTRMFLDSGVELKQSFEANAKQFYGVKVVKTNFSDANEAATKINRWVRNATNKGIKNMIQNSDTIKDSVMLILNALFFRGSWQNPFPVSNTGPGQFYVEPSVTKKVSFMKTEGNFDFAESVELDAKILRLPYVGHKLSMYFVLPRNASGLDELVRNIDPYVLTRDVQLMQELPVKVEIPKFKFEYTSHLAETLKEMGLENVFGNSANLNLIARAKKDSPELMVSDVIQKAAIEVNEKGTTASATTAVQIGNKFGQQTFIAEHPFLFFIEDAITGTILYMGRLSDPLETTGTTNPPFPPRFKAETRKPITEAGRPEVSSPVRDNFFNVELLQAVNEENDGNVIVSPLSVKVALMALVEGTGGRTRQELLSTLRLPTEVSQIREAAQRTLAPFQESSPGTELNLATRVWIAKGYQVSLNYHNALEAHYRGDMRSLDFRDPFNAANIINDWVRVATGNSIRSLIAPGSISEDTLLLLVSAIHFKGRWLKAFDETATMPRCFKVPEIGCRHVPMMENIAMYKFASMAALQAEVVQIPYADGKLSMLVFLPYREGLESLQALSKDLSFTPISTILANLTDTELLVGLPKFSINSKFDLRPALERMGIKDLFDLSANLRGIVPKSSARVETVIHDAKIEVNEVGTVAAAATGIAVVPLIGNSYETLRLDRPFLFTIVDHASSMILFAGRVISP